MNLRIVILLVFIISSCQNSKPEPIKVKVKNKAPLEFSSLTLDRESKNVGETALSGQNWKVAIDYFSREGRVAHDQFMLSHTFLRMKDYTAALGILKELIDADHAEDWMEDVEWNYVVCNKKLKRWGAHTKEIESKICGNENHRHYNKCASL